MSALGDFLEAVYGREQPFATVRASIRHWRNRHLADNARGGNRTVMGRRKALSAVASAIEECDVSVWLAIPDRARIERRRAGQVVDLTVANSIEWWKRDDQGHIETSAKGKRSSPGLSDAERHFGRILLRNCFVALDLEQIGIGQILGQECVRIRATPRLDGSLWPHWLPHGADEYEFDADRNQGVLLSISARFKGETFESSTVSDVAFGESLDPFLFQYTPELGEQVRPPDPRVVHLTLEAAIDQMPFTVLIPTKLPDPDHRRMEIMYDAPSLKSPRPDLTIMYWCFDADTHLWLHESNSPDPELQQYEWESVVCNGKGIRISDPGHDGKRIVSLEQIGTHVTIWSDLKRDQLLDLAASLAPGKRGAAE
jgi:hypothetical protein